MRSLIPFWSELGLSARESQSISPALKSPPTRKVALVLWFEMSMRWSKAFSRPSRLSAGSCGGP